MLRGKTSRSEVSPQGRPDLKATWASTPGAAKAPKPRPSPAASSVVGLMNDPEQPAAPWKGGPSSGIKVLTTISAHTLVLCRFCASGEFYF